MLNIYQFCTIGYMKNNRPKQSLGAQVAFSVTSFIMYGEQKFYNKLIKIIGTNKQAIRLLLLSSFMFGIIPIKVATTKTPNPISPEKKSTIENTKTMIKPVRML